MVIALSTIGVVSGAAAQDGYGSGVLDPVEPVDPVEPEGDPAQPERPTGPVTAPVPTQPQPEAPAPAPETPAPGTPAPATPESETPSSPPVAPGAAAPPAAGPTPTAPAPGMPAYEPLEPPEPSAPRPTAPQSNVPAPSVPASTLPVPSIPASTLHGGSAAASGATTGHLVDASKYTDGANNPSATGLTAHPSSGHRAHSPVGTVSVSPSAGTSSELRSDEPPLELAYTGPATPYIATAGFLLLLLGLIAYDAAERRKDLERLS